MWGKKKKIDPNKFNDYMKKIKLENYTKPKSLKCDWTDKKKYLIHYRLLNFYVRHGMIVDKNHEISFKQSKWLERYISFNTQKGNKAKNDFEKDFSEILVNAAFGEILEDVHNRLRVEIFKKDDIKKFFKQQSKLTFNGIHQSNENCDSYTFKQNGVKMDKPLCVGFDIWGLSKLQFFETYFDKLQLYVEQEKEN